MTQHDKSENGPLGSCVHFAPSEHEREMFAAVRAKFSEYNRTIPEDLDTDINLQRWVQTYKEVDKIYRIMTRYIDWRFVAGIAPEQIDLEKDIESLPHVQPVMRFFSASKMPLWDEKHECYVIIEGGVAQAHEIAKVIRPREWCGLVMTWTEMNLQRVLRMEKRLGRRVYTAVIYDLHDVHIADWINPLSSHSRLLQTRCDVNFEFYPGLIKQILAINGSGLMALLISRAKFFMRGEQLHMLHIVRPLSHLSKYLPANVVPVAFGGTARDDSGWAKEPETCRNERVPMTPKDFVVPGQVWRGLHYTPELHTVNIPRHHVYTLFRRVRKANCDVRWQILLSGTAIFSVRRVADEQHYKDNEELHENRTRFEASDDFGPIIYGALTTQTPRLPEEEALIIKEPGLYAFEFVNENTLFANKLEWQLYIGDE